MAATVRIDGLKELNRALGKINKEAAKTVRDAIKEAAEPVRVRAEQLSVSSITNVGPHWSTMRTGSTMSGVYVAPKARRRGGSPRPNLGRLLFREMQEALDQEEPRVVREVEKALGRLGDKASKRGQLMTSIKIEGVPGWDGDYPIDLEKLNARDHHVIKVISGMAGGQLEDALNAGDHDVVVAIAVCALYRAGRKIDPHTFWDSPFATAELGAITLDAEAEDDALPPAPSGTASSDEPAEKPQSSGPTSNGSSESPEKIPSPTGVPV